MKKLIKVLACAIIIIMGAIFLAPMATQVAAADLPGEPIERHPTGNGDRAGEWYISGESWGWQCVDESPPDDSDYILGVGTNDESSYRLFTFSPYSYPNYTDADVTVYYRARDNDWHVFAGNNIQAALQINGVLYHGGSYNPPVPSDDVINGIGPFEQYSHTWQVNPATGQEWTGAEIAQIESFGVFSNDLQPSIRVSAVWMVITFDYVTPYVKFESASPHGSEGDPSEQSFGVILSNPSANTITANYSVAQGSATPGVDYNASSGMVTFLPGETRKTVSGIFHLDDQMHEGPETVVFTLSNPVNAYLGSVTTAIWTIDDDDPNNYLTISAEAVNEGSSGDAFVPVTVKLWPVSDRTVSARYATSDGTAIGTGPMRDYIPASGTLTFAPGEKSKTINITVIGDKKYEPWEYFWVNLTDQVGVSLNDYSPGVVRIDNDDSPPVINEFVADQAGDDTYEYIEIFGAPSTNYGDYQVLVIDNDPGENPGVIDRIYTVGTTDALGYWRTPFLHNELENGSLILFLVEGFTGTLGQDLDANNDQYPEISPWDSQLGVVDEISVFNSAPIGNFYFPWATLFDTGGGSRLPSGTGEWFKNNYAGAGLPGFSGIQTVAAEALNTPGMENARCSGPSTVQFATSASSGSEDTNTNLTVNLTPASNDTITVQYSVTGGTASGSGVDYTCPDGTLTFTPGITSQTIQINVNNDSLDESNETIKVSLSSPVNAVLGSPDSHTFTINDDDSAPSISINDVTVTEGSTAVFTITLSAASSNTVSVDFDTVDGTAVAGSDYYTHLGRVFFTPGAGLTQTITVQVPDDTVHEGDESFILMLSNPTYATISKPNGICQISDNDLVTTYTVTFHQSGLPDGTSWNATFDNVTYAGANGSNIVISGVTWGNHTWSSEVVTGTDVRYQPVPGSGNPNVTGNLTINVSFTTQYYLTVNNGGHGTVGGQGWYNAGVSAHALVDSTIITSGDTRFVFNGWSGDASGPGAISSDITMNSTKIATATWKMQYRITFAQGGIGADAGDAVIVTVDGRTKMVTQLQYTDWYDSRSTINFAYASLIPAGTGKQYVWAGTSGLARTQSGNLSPMPGTVLGNYKTQYYLTVNNGGNGTVGGEGWYDAGANAQATISPLTLTDGDTRYDFAGWSGDASGNGSPSGNILMNAPKTATATWNETPIIKDQTISFGEIPNKTYGDSDFIISATSSSGLSVTFTASGNCEIVGNTVHITGAGNGIVTANQAGDAEYNAALAVPRSFIILPKEASITANNQTKAFGQDNPTLTAAVTGEVSGGDTINYSLSTTATQFSNVGDYPITVTLGSNPNYSVTTHDGTFSVNKADAVINVSGWSGTYDGATHGATGKATGVGNSDLSADLNLGDTFINVPGGTAHWTFSGGTNYLDESGDINIIINKASATVTLGSLTQTYNGSALSPTATTTPPGLAVTWTGAPQTNAGSSPVTATIDDPNYQGSTSNTFVIQKASANITVTPYHVTFDGSEHVATGTATGVGGVNLVANLDLNSTSHLDAGDYPGDTWRFSGGTNYNDASDTVHNQIDPAEAVISGMSGWEGAYDGLPHGITAGTVTGVDGADLSAGLSLGDTFTNVPGGVANWSFNLPNYISQSGSMQIRISKTDALVTVEGWSGIYDDLAHGADGSATGVGGANLNDSLNLGTTFINVPGGTAHWTFSGGTNYNNQSGDVNIDISPADANITVTGWTGVYDGYAHGATGTATGVDREVEGLTLGPAFTNAPGGTATWTFDNPNYIPESGSVPIVINKADADIIVDGWSGTYDGATHGATGKATGVGNSDLSADLNLGDTFINVPGGTAHWTFSGGTNYLDESGSVKVIINPADAIVVIKGWTDTYDAASHGASGSAIGVGGADLSASLDLGATFTNVPGGTVNWSFSNPNYISESGSVTIAIKKADATVIVNGWTGTYDGLAHGASGTATGVGDANLSTDLGLGDSFTNFPGGTAHWTFNGGTNYENESGDVDIVINKADAAVTVSGWTGTFDALDHGATGSASGVGGSDLSSYLDLGSTFINVPGGTVHWSFSGGTNYLDEVGSVDITINKAVLVVTAENKTSQFSDPRQALTWTITGFVGGQNGVTGAPEMNVALSDPVSQQPGSYPISAGSGSLAANNYSFTFVNGTYKVTEENAAMTFTVNPVSVKVHADGGDNTAFTIQVTVTQAGDGDPGDLSNISTSGIKLSFKAVGSGAGYGPVAATSFDPSTGLATFKIPQDVLVVETYSMEVTLTGGWYTADPAEDVLCVYDPSLGFTTGGGWFYWPQDSSKLSGARTNFGYTMKYNNKATNIQGSFLIIAHLADGSIYRIKSNALYGLALNTQTGIATFSGKCTFTYPVAGSDPVTVGGQEFMVYVQDNNNPGEGIDTFWFTVLGQPFTLDSDKNKKAAGNEIQPINGGNIVVPHTPASTTRTGK